MFKLPAACPSPKRAAGRTSNVVTPCCFTTLNSADPRCASAGRSDKNGAPPKLIVTDLLVRWPVGQVGNHGFDKPVSVRELECPVGDRFLADRGKRGRRNLSPAQRSGSVCRVNLYRGRELQQLLEELMVEHCSEFVRTNLPIAQIRTTHVTSEKCVTGK